MRAKKQKRKDTNQGIKFLSFFAPRLGNDKLKTSHFSRSTSPMKKVLLPMLLGIVLGSFLVGTIALAQLETGLEYGTATGLGTQDLRESIMKIIRAVLGFLGVVAVVILIYGGWVWMTAAGNADRIALAKRILINAIIGLVIILSSFMITSFIITQLCGASGCEPPPPSCSPGEISGCLECDSGGSFSIFHPEFPGCDPSIINQCLVVNITPSGTDLPMNVVARVRFNHPINTADDPSDSIQVYNITGLSPGDPLAPIVPTIKVFDGSTLVELLPDAILCPVGGGRCFPADSDFEIRSEDPAIQCGGFNLVCGALSGSNCIKQFSTGNSVDLFPPDIMIIGNQICEGPSTILEALVNDDYGIAYVDFFEDPLKTLIGTDNFLSVPPAELAKVLWDTSSYVAGDTVQIDATAQDYDLNSTDALSYEVTFRVGHCCNQEQDESLGETGVDCGGVCEPCSPVIEWIDPDAGTEGNLVTIHGRRFEVTPGTVEFLGSGAGSVTGVNAACGNWWTDEEVIIGVPAGFDDGPLELIRDDGESDRTDQAPGSNIADFVEDGIARPGLCEVLPNPGPPSSIVGLFGLNFFDPSLVYFGGQLSGGIPVVLGPNSIIGATVPALQTGDVMVRSFDETSEEFSNPVNYMVDPSVDVDIYECSKSVVVCGPTDPDDDLCQPGYECDVATCGCIPEEPTEPEPISCDSDPNNFDGDGAPICDPDQDLCPSGYECNVGSCVCETEIASGNDSAYTWFFTTTSLGPRVAETCNRSFSCDVGSIASPTPFNRDGTNLSGAIVGFRPDDGEVPIDATIGATFTDEMQQVSLSGATINVFECAPGDPTDCTINISGSWDPPITTANSFQYIPTGVLTADTWYQVVLNASQIFGINGVALAPNHASGNYLWIFKTRIDTTPGEVGCIYVDPASQTSFQINDLKDWTAQAADQDFVCVTLNPNLACSLGWGWTTGGPEALIKLPPPTSFTATSTSLLETVPGPPVNVLAQCNNPTGALVGAGELTINFSSPVVIGKFPNCGSACLNSKIGATFSLPMDVTSVQNAMRLYICFDDPNCDDGNLISFATFTPNDPSEEPNSFTATVEPGDIDGNDEYDFWLLPNNYYRVVITNIAASDLEDKTLENLNYSTSGSGSNDAYSWVFKTQQNYGVCLPHTIDVRPASAIVAIGDAVLYSSAAKASPEQCFGQSLDPYSFDWAWQITPVIPPPPVVAEFRTPLRDACGNGVIEQGEDCDDGNLTNSDGCSNLCLTELDPDLGNSNYNIDVCGNGVVELSEQCERPTSQGCSFNCTLSGSVPGVSLCGDGIIEIGEQCDDADLLQGSLAQSGDGCSASCLVEDTSRWFCRSNANLRFDFTQGECFGLGDCDAGFACFQLSDAGGNTNTGPVCGNGVIESGEECDFGGVCSDNPAASCTSGNRFSCNDPFTATCDVVSINGCSPECINEGSIQEAIDPPFVGPFQIADALANGFTAIQSWVASFSPSAGGPFGNGDLQVGDGGLGLDDPIIIDRYPDCGTACANAGMGALFNVSMNTGTFNTSNIFLYECGTDRLCDISALTLISGIGIAYHTTVNTDDTLDIGLPFSYNRIDFDQDGTVDGPALLPNTYYRIVVNTRVKSDSPVRNLVGLNFDDPNDAGLSGKDSNSWIFKTQSSSAACTVGRVEVHPEKITLPEGTLLTYFAEPWTQSGRCDPLFGDDRGQRLNPYFYNWEWEVFDVVLGENAADFLAPPRDGCGNSIVEYGEDCDDGNIVSGDGCSGIGALIACQHEGSNIAYGSICGNNKIETGEDCDDNNTISNDGCSNICLWEGNANYNQSVCGNHIIEFGEQCDEGTEPDGDDADGCTDICTFSGSASSGSICGDNRITKGENCDDGDLASGNPIISNDGCTGVDDFDDGSECSSAALANEATCKNPANARWCYWTGSSCATRQCLTENPAILGVSIALAQTPPSTCKLESAIWNTDFATENEPVVLYVNGSNCGGENLLYTIMEYDIWPNDDDFVESFDSTSLNPTWTAVYSNEGGLDPDPEYYFVVTVVGSNPLETIDSGTDGSELLEVELGSALQCSDGFDNDQDGWTDLFDPGCDDANDNDESFIGSTECSNQVDDDNDFLIDGNDPGCDDANDNDETNIPFLPQCYDGIDNDGDGYCDILGSICTDGSIPGDPGCDYGDDNDETDLPPLPQCYDGIDNDGDGLIDYPNDPGCEYGDDDDESNSPSLPACSDAIDNDGDGLIDYPNDPGCSYGDDNDETNPPSPPQCSDDFDNDADSLIDYPDDPGCIDANDNDETDLPLDTMFDGDTTDFSSEDDLTDVTGGVLERTGLGRISFGSESIDFSNRKLDAHVYIANNLIGINSIALPELANENARLTLYNLPFINPILYEDGNPCIHCQIISYSGGDLTFDVDGFSSYSAADPTSSCDLISAIWTTDLAEEGEPVTLYVNGSNCIGKTFDYRIYIDNGNSQDEIVWYFTSNSLNPSWTTVYVSDQAGGSEYYFDVSVVGNPNETIQSSSGNLNVYKASSSSMPQCYDRIDNDGDGLIDYPNDPGCEYGDDDDESNSPSLPACSDAIDNDGDGLVDYPNDPGCGYGDDNDETDPPSLPACSDGNDNDGDGDIDYPDDSGCIDANDNDETDMPSATIFGGDTTDFSLEIDLANVTNSILEQTGLGKIEFGSEPIDFSNRNLDAYVYIANNLIGINSVALPEFANENATLTLYNLPFVNPIVYEDGVPCTHCQIVNYSGGNLTFTVDHFSSFSAADSSLSVCGNGKVEYGEECDNGTEPDGINTDGCTDICLFAGSVYDDGRIDPYQIVQTTAIGSPIAEVNEEIRAWHNLAPLIVGVGELKVVSGGLVAFAVIGHSPPVGDPSTQCLNVEISATFSRELDVTTIDGNITLECAGGDCIVTGDNLITEYSYRTIRGSCVANECQFAGADGINLNFGFCSTSADCVGSKVNVTGLDTPDGFLNRNSIFNMHLDQANLLDASGDPLTGCGAIGTECSWDFQTSANFCNCDYVGVSVDPTSGGADTVVDYFTCAGDSCGLNTPFDPRDDDAISSITGNQHKYYATCYDVNNPTDSRIALSATGIYFTYIDLDPDDIFDPTPFPLSFDPIEVITANPRNGKADVRVVATEHTCASTGQLCNPALVGACTPNEVCKGSTNACDSADPNACGGNPINCISACQQDIAAIQTVTVTSFICNNPWPALPDFPYIDNESNSIDPDTNFTMYYCRDAGGPSTDDDLPALGAELVSSISGSPSIKDFLFPISATGDAIGIKILKNPLHLSPGTWYRTGLCSDVGVPDFDDLCFSDADCFDPDVSEQKTCELNIFDQGSFSQSTVDGYEAIREGRTAYVGATNLDSTDLFSNIYLLSYNDDASASTVEIFNRILDKNKIKGTWSFNNTPQFTNHRFCLNSGYYTGTTIPCTTVGLADTSTCSALAVQNQSACEANANSGCVWNSSLSSCLALMCEPILCTNDFECPNLVCSADKEMVVRDAKRFGDLRNIQILLDNYSSVNGVFPLLSAGTYVPSTTFSVWPSWQQTLGDDLGTQIFEDPLNRFVGCPGFTCDADGNGIIDLGETTICDAAVDTISCPSPGSCLPVDADQAQTCWDEVNLQFYCPQDRDEGEDAFVYGYRAAGGGLEYQLYTRFEYEGSGSWRTRYPSPPPPGLYEFPISNITTPVCQIMNLEVGAATISGGTTPSNCSPFLFCYGGLPTDGTETCNNVSECIALGYGLAAKCTGDADGDGACDFTGTSDNCTPYELRDCSNWPTFSDCFNPGQDNANFPDDDIGDECDPFCKDDDKDGVCDNTDNCPRAWNIADKCPITSFDPHGQCDIDGDGIGDSCDQCTDIDGDLYGNPGDVSCTNGPAKDCEDDPSSEPLAFTIHPGATEICTDGIDNNCDGLIDGQDTLACPTNTCDDTDGSPINITQVGTVSGESGGSSYSNDDICSGGAAVLEWGCDVDSPVSAVIACGGTDICSAGECGPPLPPSDSCLDSDGGGLTQDRTGGTVSGIESGLAYSNSDTCNSPTRLTEYYCSGATKQSNNKNCPDNGASWTCDSSGTKHKCIPPPPPSASCAEAGDAGPADYANRGNVSGDDGVGGTFSILDSCTGVGERLTEMFCNGVNPDSSNEKDCTDFGANFDCISGECALPSPPADTCSDSDGGGASESQTQGTVSGNVGWSSFSDSDACISPTLLSEQSCTGNTQNPVATIDCVAINGAGWTCDSLSGGTQEECVPPPDSCIDTDLGPLDYLNSGTVSGFSGGSAYIDTDNCSGGGSGSVTLEIGTDEDATCGYSTSIGTPFSAMTPFTATGGTKHSSVVSGLTNGSTYFYYVKCQDTAGNITLGDHEMSFGIDAPIDLTPPTLLTLAPHGEIPALSDGDLMLFTLSGSSHCKFSDVSGTSYTDMTDFTITNSVGHRNDFPPFVIPAGFNTFYVLCKDTSFGLPGNINTVEHVIRFNKGGTYDPPPQIKFISPQTNLPPFSAGPGSFLTEWGCNFANKISNVVDCTSINSAFDCVSGECVLGDESGLCFNGIDDDLDLAIDCADDDCWGEDDGTGPSGEICCNTDASCTTWVNTNVSNNCASLPTCSSNLCFFTSDDSLCGTGDDACGECKTSGVNALTCSAVATDCIGDCNTGCTEISTNDFQCGPDNTLATPCTSQCETCAGSAGDYNCQDVNGGIDCDGPSQCCTPGFLCDFSTPPMCVSCPDADKDGVCDDDDWCPYDPDDNFDLFVDSICAVGCIDNGSNTNPSGSPYLNGWLCDGMPADPSSVVYDNCAGGGSQINTGICSPGLICSNGGSPCPGGNNAECTKYISGSCPASSTCLVLFGADERLNVYLNGIMVAGNLYLPPGFVTNGELIGGNGTDSYPDILKKIFINTGRAEFLGESVIAFESFSGTWNFRQIRGGFVNSAETGWCDLLDNNQKWTSQASASPFPAWCYTDDDSQNTGIPPAPQGPNRWLDPGYIPGPPNWILTEYGNGNPGPLNELWEGGPAWMFHTIQGVWNAPYSDPFVYSHGYCRSNTFTQF